LRSFAAPRRVRREWDDDWKPLPDPVCPICRQEVQELLPYGFWAKRLACAQCIERRRRMLEAKARVIAARPARGAATEAKMRIIRYYSKEK